MAGTLKQVEFVVAWQAYSVGDRITPNGTLRDWLVGNGYARVVDEIERPARPAPMSARAAAKIKQLPLA